jgi:hypothetical protein
MSVVGCESLVHDLPATLVALRDGVISYRHAQIMVGQTATLEPDAISELEAPPHCGSLRR